MFQPVVIFCNMCSPLFGGCGRFENVNQAYFIENEATIKAMHELVVKQWKKE
jgi:hypothetical protein